MLPRNTKPNTAFLKLQETPKLATSDAGNIDADHTTGRYDYNFGKS